MPILYKWKERTKVVLQKLIVCFFFFFPFVMSKMIHTNFQEQYTTTTYIVLVYKKCLLLAHSVLRKFRMSLWQAWHMDVALWEEGDQLVLILALIFRNGRGVGHKPPQMGRWEAQRQSCDARGWHTLCKGGGGECHDAQKLDHCLFVCPELKFSSSISNSGFWIRNKPVCGQASPSKSKTNYICCCYMERWRVGGGWKPLVLTCMPHTLWKKTRSRAYPNHCTQSQYSSSASCKSPTMNKTQ